MNNFDIYKDIAKRTNGDIYIGVVGPVRTGKSTFITKMLNTLVLPNIKDKYNKERTIDELPQSGDGKSIMTTQPKFIPNDSINIKLDNNISFNIRAIDCVGYLVDGALGHLENNQPRLVSTPWSEVDLPFEKAAEIGTKKVIANHSTVAVLITTDGTITEIPRTNYINAEERVVKELQENKKPFIIILNTKKPKDKETLSLCNKLSEKYKETVKAYDVENMTEADFNEAFTSILLDFPISSINIKMPQWMEALPFDNKIIKKIIDTIYEFAKDIIKIKDVLDDLKLFENDDDFMPVTSKNILMGEGKVVLEITPKPELFYKVLSDQCGMEILNDYHLITYIKQLHDAKIQYEKFKSAMEQVNEFGYGVVHPGLNEMTLDEPKILKQGSKFGVKLKASAPSLHIMRVDIETEVNSLVGNEQQSEELVKYLMSEFENNPNDIWDTKMFGKSLHEMVNEGLQNKLIAMPVEVQKKMRKTLGRIVNEGKGGVICILL